MSTPKFADTHNLVAFLEKPDESNGFKEIIDFLIFWATVKVKTVNGEHQLQALVDKKKVIITETSIRSDLNLEDAGGTDCLPTDTIFEELARMGYEKPSPKLTFYKAFFSPQWKFLIHTITQCLSAKTTAWNEFSSTMAFVIICLATNQKFNMSKYIFDAMVKHLEGGVKFLMYPRFVQVFINQQLGDMSHHKKTYVNPSHTKKIFANMKREGKDFSRRVTPLFATMMVQANQEEGVDSDIPTDSQQTPITTQPSTSKPQKKQSRRKQRKDIEVSQSSASTEPMTEKETNEESVPKHSYDPSQSGEDRMQLHELMNLCTKLSDRVLALETTKTTQALEIASLKSRVKKLEKKASKRTHKFKRLYRVGTTRRVESSNDEGLGANPNRVGELSENVSTATTTVIATPAITTPPQQRAKRIAFREPVKSTVTTIVPSQKSKDKGKAIMIKPKNPLKKKDQIELDEELARETEAESCIRRS
ncbi:hypothetical protein Tco_0878298 [Tanacetum coccineum]|uniref:Synaptobrevin, longin-like domain protein n=1 Tax=Tanacetum coccineum TaxID=301880 RepID=A0ABQ5C0I1_9ASTR